MSLSKIDFISVKSYLDGPALKVLAVGVVVVGLKMLGRGWRQLIQVAPYELEVPKRVAPCHNAAQVLSDHP